MTEPRPAPRASGGPSPIAPADHDGTATVVDTVAGSSTLRRELLLRLRHDGPSSPERLAAALGVSRTGVLQQLHGLEGAGLVAREAIRHGVGRPRHVYDITPAAQDLFPTNYDGLANGLLAAIHAIGGDDLIDEVFEERKRLTGDRVRRRIAERVSDDASVVERTRELAVIQDEQGYLAEAVVGADGVIRLVERNCAIHRVAADHVAVCQAELDLFREILGTSVIRETHIAAGDRCCAYRVGGTTD
jgi:predicted ArsR family transcriptional regulator